MVGRVLFVGRPLVPELLRSLRASRCTYGGPASEGLRSTSFSVCRITSSEAFVFDQVFSILLLLPGLGRLHALFQLQNITSPRLLHPWQLGPCLLRTLVLLLACRGQAYLRLLPSCSFLVFLADMYIKQHPFNLNMRGIEALAFRRPSGRGPSTCTSRGGSCSPT